MMAAMATTRRADMFTADGKPSDDDLREHGQRLGDERATLAESLVRHLADGAYRTYSCAYIRVTRI